MITVNPPLSDKGRKARYGVSYLRNVCANAGYNIEEISVDEDNQAVDAKIGFVGADVRVQVKCTQRSFTLADEHLTWTVEAHWRQKWSENVLPCYFLAVQVPSGGDPWIDHLDAQTVHNTSAYWTRIDVPSLGTNIAVKKDQRLTETTLHEWQNHLLQHFTPWSAQ